MAADRGRHFREIRRADAEYQWDLVFCGVAFPNRLAWIKAAAPLLARYRTLILGPGWPSLRFTSGRRISNAELADLYNASRIVLNLPRAFNVSNQHDYPASTPAPRTFEAAAAGGFQLVAADRPELHRYFNIPAEMDLFLSVGDLQAKIEHYLGNPDARIEAARRAAAAHARSASLRTPRGSHPGARREFAVVTSGQRRRTAFSKTLGGTLKWAENHNQTLAACSNPGGRNHAEDPIRLAPMVNEVAWLKWRTKTAQLHFLRTLGGGGT